ncbi:hypothetical protein TNCT_625881 [Trichonephila clavata]|uniref:Uncharacterized protein n=1 Tax=Trichonephila clavata TaxID=2740835 RepID=A0A8X6HUE8_TRICU|nr:hypothetical protein TNCT_625881 [Trichonephila clavata]
MENNKVTEQAAERERRRVEMDFELQKLKLQLKTQKSGVPQGNDTDISEQPKLELKKLIPTFNSDDSPRRTYKFVKEIIIREVQSRLILEEITCLLREDGGKCLTPEQINELGKLLKIYKTVFEPG